MEKNWIVGLARVSRTHSLKFWNPDPLAQDEGMNLTGNPFVDAGAANAGRGSVEELSSDDLHRAPYSEAERVSSDRILLGQQNPFMGKNLGLSQIGRAFLPGQDRSSGRLLLSGLRQLACNQ